MLLKLKDAEHIAMDAILKGEELDLAPLTIIILDAGGHILYARRHETAGIGRIEIALAKAAGCLAMGLDGSELARRAQTMPSFITAVTAILPKGLVPVPGGVLIRNKDGNIVGAIGISGDTSDNDEICARFGLDTWLEANPSATD